ncbi:MAG: hypothetical protein ACK5Y6_07655 [Pseudomonadota bacterium]
MKRVDFETSTELKRLFSQEFEAWRARTRMGLEELSGRCGVSRSYLAHIGRYGRIPSKPVLILLALNFGMKNPEALIRAARFDEAWPFESPVGIESVSTKDSGFLSIKLDMDGLVDAIKGVVREQFRPRSLRDLVGDRPLRIGLNLLQPWLFTERPDGSLDMSRGLMPELCGLLENSLRCPISTVVVPFHRYLEKLRVGEIDLYGPMIATPQAPGSSFFSLPVTRVGMSALMRKRPHQSKQLPPVPTSFEALRDPSYQIAVIKDSRAHLIANTRLNRTNSSLLICDTLDEAIDRLVLGGVSKPADVLICSSMNSERQARSHPDELLALFNSPQNMIDICDSSFAIRPDWPEALPILNQALAFIMSSGGFAKRSQEIIKTNQLGIFPVSDDFTQSLAVNGG